MKYLAFITIVCLGTAARLSTANPISYIPYSFGYSTADGMSREESGAGGRVTGSYSYTDANGDLRQVRYVADEDGYHPEGDIGVDRKTAAAAAALAALAPKGPEPNYAAPVVSQTWSPAPQKSYRSFENYRQADMVAPAVDWNQMTAPIVSSPVAYQVNTPTHKIWVKY